MEFIEKPALLAPYDNNLGNPTTFPSFSTYGGTRRMKNNRSRKTKKNKGSRKIKKTKRTRRRNNQNK